MIRAGQIVSAVASAIETDAAVLKLCKRYNDAPKLHVGHVADEVLQPEDQSAHIAVGYADETYDMGYTGQDREVPILLRVVLADPEAVEDGRRTEYVGPMMLDQLCDAIITAIKAISGLGDELAKAAVTMETSESWPVCKAKIDCMFRLSRGTAFEPAI